MAEVLAFPSKALFNVNSDRAGIVADNDHNRTEREDQGPPIGSKAWTCNCGCFAFYITTTSFHCYECHAEQSFD